MKQKKRRTKNPIAKNVSRKSGAGAHKTIKIPSRAARERALQAWVRMTHFRDIDDV